MNSLTSLVASFVERNKFSRHFIACSGGVDSMVLLDLLWKTGKPVEVLHVNYGLRGTSSNADEDLVREICKEKGIIVHVLKLNFYEELQAHGGNLQQRARERRYAYFDEKVKPRDGLFLAHHLDDQLETFFLAMTRGGGVRAMACMPEIKGNHCRPLLGVSKEHILDYAYQKSIRWREDESNLELRYSRNKWRNVFLPLVEKLFPEFKTEIPFLITCFQEKLRVIQSKAAALREFFFADGKMPFDWFEIEEGEVVAELLRIAMLPHGLSAELRKLMRAAKGARLVLDHSRFKMVYREDGYFYFSEEASLKLPELVTSCVDALPENFDKQNIYLDPDKINGKLQLRYWQKGDRIKPPGLKGSKLISDVLSDAKISAFSKKKQIVLHDDVNVLWCVGFVISREALATHTSRKMQVSLKNFEPSGNQSGDKQI